MTENPFLGLKDITLVGCRFLINDFSRKLNKIIQKEDPNNIYNRMSGQMHSELRNEIRYKLLAEIGNEDFLDDAIKFDARAKNSYRLNTKMTPSRKAR